MPVRIDERVADAGGARAEDVGREDVAEMERARRRNAEPLEGDAEDARVGLLDADLAAVDDEVEVAGARRGR